MTKEEREELRVILLNHCIDESRTGTCGWSAISQHAFEGNIPAVKFLLELGAKRHLSAQLTIYNKKPALNFTEKIRSAKSQAALGKMVETEHQGIDLLPNDKYREIVSFWKGLFHLPNEEKQLPPDVNPSVSPC